jgi:hypothetical protein
MKNLLIIHLESISNQIFRTFAHAFPETRDLFQQSLRFDNFFSAATSSLMAIASVWHGNSFEFDHSRTLEGVKPAGLNRNLYSVLSDQGYHAKALCLNMNHERFGSDISIWPKDLKPVGGTGNFEEFVSCFDSLTNRQPFALYFWNLLTHISNHTDQTRTIGHLAGQQEKKYELTDRLIGNLIRILKQKNIFKDTVIVVFGDHGDDYWTHGFKGGWVHAIEPYTSIIATPMCICAPGLTSGRYVEPASTIDIRNTVLGLLGLSSSADYAHSGINLLEQKNKIVYSNSLLAGQGYHPEFKVHKSYSAINADHILLVTERGLELYNYLLDPGNACNLLHFFSHNQDGTLRWKHRQSANEHLRYIFKLNPQNFRHLQDSYTELRDALHAYVKLKNSYAGKTKLPLGSLTKINRKGYAAFYEYGEDHYIVERIKRKFYWLKKRMLGA